jgi:mevalonate kinase
MQCITYLDDALQMFKAVRRVFGVLDQQQIQMRDVDIRVEIGDQRGCTSSAAVSIVPKLVERLVEDEPMRCCGRHIA